ncbi:hypothetical protein B7P43_G12410 [Cryptotermes secundus]|uniref:Uncharacterized protein n=1 Tax=Cryptotermes secundus TaxID=105785 RepID=A0A2J7Q5S0_9NEOP|nr:hypothetical protein B7P43_G12410 [Cryptotermes secundus]
MDMEKVMERLLFAQEQMAARQKADREEERRKEKEEMEECRRKEEEEMEECRRKEKEEMEENRRKEKEEMEENRRKEKEEMEENRKKDKEDLMAKLDSYQEKAEIGLNELLARLEDVRQTNRRELQEMMDVNQARTDKKARPEGEKPASANRKLEAAGLREVPIQDTEVMPVGEPKKKRRRDRK